MIDVIELTKSYSQTKVFNKFSFQFENGIHGIVGSNGSGKTTLFDCIAGLKKYNGKIARPLSFSYLPSELYFYQRVRAIEFIEFSCHAKQIVIDYKHIETLNAYFKLPLNNYAADYSTGMKKKLGIMALVLQDSDLCILDEPFNGLDLEGVIRTKQLIKGLKAKTVLISSHIIESLTNICDSIHHIKNGKITKSYLPTNFNIIEQEIAECYLIS